MWHGTVQSLQGLFILRERFNKIFDSAHDKAKCDSPTRWTPLVDIYETSESFLVKVDLPDVEESDLTVNVSDDVLTISGERRSLRAGRHYHQVERCHGTFSRSFSLTESIDREAIKATMQDGVLKVFLPKKIWGTKWHIEIT